MTVRVLAGAAVGAALTAMAAGALSLREPKPAAPAAPSAAAEPPRSEPPQGEPLPPAPFLLGERPRVPAGILARAASARALERGPSCPQVEAPQEPSLCAPEQRRSIEIEWHVAPRDP